MRVDFFANSQSIHVKQWTDALCSSGLPAGRYTVHGPEGLDRHSWTSFDFKVKALSYVVAGLSVRFGDKAPALAHAHDASGYGTMARVSGVPFVLTTYGSEVFRAHEKSPAYRWNLRANLDRATLITCTADSMAECLTRDFGQPESKIRCFGLGAPQAFTRSAVARASKRAELQLAETEMLFLSSRRHLPNYRIEEILSAFELFRESGRRGKLVLLEGGVTGPYALGVEAQATRSKFSRDIMLMSGFRPQQEIADLLNASDLVLSVPMTDQKSTSIMEAFATGVPVILSDISSYREMLSSELALKWAGEEVGCLSKLLIEACDYAEAMQAMGTKAAHWLRQTEGAEAVRERILRVYEEAWVANAGK